MDYLERIKEETVSLFAKVERLEQKAEELKIEIDKLQAKTKSAGPEEELIPIPDNIVFKQIGGQIALASPNNKLEMNWTDDSFTVIPARYGDRIYPKGLKKVDYDQLQPGDFCTPSDSPRKPDDIELVLENKKHKHWSESENLLTVDRNAWETRHWHKVIF